IVRFRNGQQNRMIATLHPFLSNRQSGLGVSRRLVDYLAEDRLAHMIGTAACNQRATWVEQLHRPKIDFLVTGGRLGKSRLAPGKRWRIEDDRVEMLAHPLQRPQFVEDIADARVDRHAVSISVCANTANRVL